MGLGVGIGIAVALTLALGSAGGGGGGAPVPFDIETLSIVERLRGGANEPGDIITWPADVGQDVSVGLSPTAVAGAYNGKTTVRFNTATNTHLTEGTSTYLNGATACTISMLVKTTSNSSLWFQRGAGGLRIQSASGVWYCTIIGGGTYGYTPTVATDVPQTIIWVYDGAGATDLDRLKCYVDGVEVALSFSGTIPSALSLSAGSYVGGFPGATFAEGDLVELVIFDQAYGPTQVAQIHSYYADTYLLARVVVGGDSLTYGSPGGPGTSWTRQFSDGARGLAAGRDVRTVAVGGWLISDLAAAAPTQVFPLAAPYAWKKYFVAAIGSNNLASVQSVAAALVEYDALVADARAAGYQVIGMTVLPRQDAAMLAVQSQASFDAKRAAWKTAMLARVASGALVALCDIAAVSGLDDPTNYAWYVADLVHLTPDGYGLYATAFAATIDAL